MRKRVSLFKYNLKMKKEMGAYDPIKEQQMIQANFRSLNLFDFRAGKVGDFYLIDEFSDASEFGGESETTLSLVEDTDNPGQQTCKLNEKLKPFSSACFRKINKRAKQLAAHRLHVFWVQVPKFVSKQLYVLQWSENNDEATLASLQTGTVLGN